MTVKDNINVQVKNSKDIAKIMTAILNLEKEQDKTKEHFWIIGLNASNRITYIELIALGSLTATIVHPREVFKIAIMRNSASIIACHNHPSGNVHPSKDDISLTNRLAKAGEIIGIKLVDHIILAGDNNFKSLVFLINE
jgi:DNA repair protein RadC